MELKENKATKAKETDNEISEVFIYKGIDFGGQVVTYVLLDSAYSDKTKERGNKARLVDVGVEITNSRTSEKVVVPFSNVSYYRIGKNPKHK